MEKKVLITGVAGFLGSQLAKDLLAAGCVVVGVDNLSSGKITNIKGLPEDRFIFKEMDVCSVSACSKVGSIEYPALNLSKKA